MKYVSRSAWVLPVLLMVCLTAPAATINVPDDQPTIQAGINAAGTGDTVLVQPGTYSENLNFQGKAITLASLFHTTGDTSYILQTVIDGENSGRVVSFKNGEDNASVLTGFKITRGQDGYFGGGIYCTDASSPTINRCLVTANYGEYGGGMACLENSRPMLTEVIFYDNDAYSGGGANLRTGSHATFVRCKFYGNHATHGGAVMMDQASPSFDYCTFYDNSAGFGAALYCYTVADAELTNCSFTGNAAGTDGGAVFTGLNSNARPVLKNCVLWGNTPQEIRLYATTLPTVTFSDVQGGTGQAWFEASCMDEDPLFIDGTAGDMHLTAGSPCIDTGDPDSPDDPDGSRVDMGAYCYISAAMIIAGPGPGENNPPQVRVYRSAYDTTLASEFQAYGAPYFGVRLAVGDLDGNGIDEILTGPGPGTMYGPHVRAFTHDGTAVPGVSFLAYGTPRFGVNVAAGDIDGDGFDEIVTGAGPGAVFGPHVRAFNHDGGSGTTPVSGVSFFAYGTPKWGVNICCGDIDGDGFDEIVTGAGPGAIYGPHVRGWNVDNGPATAIPAVSFLAYGTNKFGVNVSCGDVDNDGIDEIITGAGPGVVFAGHVRGWNFDGGSMSTLPGFNFFAWPASTALYGVNVCAGRDLTGDDRDDLLTGAGPDPDRSGWIRGWEYDGAGVEMIFELEAFGAPMEKGATVAAGLF